MARRGEPPPIPLLRQGSRLTDREFEAACCQLDEYIVLEALGNDSKPAGYAVTNITNMHPWDDSYHARLRGC